MKARKHWLVVSIVILIASVSLVIITFWAGYIMGELHYKHQISESLKKGDTLASIKLCYEWGKSSDKALRDPLYYVAVAASFNKLGNQEMVKWNLARAAELLKE